ncbi:glycosyl hydrolase-related protein [Paenibacillus sp. OV219]|uniref:glycoside hydrolase family 38 N-terminal domain-containing protein n=1 Tax=Paenibacillus sp. OV219 TaxID=1884377 RepID=UPI000B8189A8|nr:glycosyl hydrolase-related protein [Paenibacillus sp. OV219]
MPKIKEVLVLHHSHLDVGYTTAQPILLAMQSRYIDQALELCEMTEEWEEYNRFRWTCESTLPVLNWLETASEQQIVRFKHYLHNGQMSIVASYMHMTPLTSAEEAARTLYPLRRLREVFGIELKTAIHHDINGQPWPYAQLLLDAGVEFFIMGINIHFGGVPFNRPNAFHWEAPDRRKLLTFNGEHYSLFSQICDVNAKCTDKMADGLSTYLRKIEANPEYPFDFIYLTATNLPLYDNNPPDRDLAELLKKWNEEDRGIRISFVTPEQLYKRVREHAANLPTHAGDWTDYWNFGSASSAKETKLSRRTKHGMKAVELLDAFLPEEDLSFVRIKKEAWHQIHLYDEHTWGAHNSVSEPYNSDVEIQWMHKAHYAYQANSLTGYLLNVHLEKLAGNPLQSEEPEGLLLLNPTSVALTHDIRIPSSFKTEGRHLGADRMRHVLMNNDVHHQGTSYGTIDLPPFSWRKIPFATLQEAEWSASIMADVGEVGTEGEGPWLRKVKIQEGAIETPFHSMRFDPLTGRITSLIDKRQDWEVLDTSSPWALFQYVQETVDPIHHLNIRSAIFPRNVERGNNSLTDWNHNWKASRQSYTRLNSCRVERSAHSASLILSWEAPGVEQFEQTYTFFSYQPDIEMKASFFKQDITTPEGTYFAIPLNLQKWRCHYDTAGQWVELDAQQMQGVCRDYITIDKSVSIYDGQHGVTMSCPDAPLVQVGNFNFGKEQQFIEKNDNPLLLAWPMNNYWDTNFRGSQPGAVTFTYYLNTCSSFDPSTAMISSIGAMASVFATPVIDCKEEVGQFIQLSGDGVQVFDVKPAEDNRGIVVRLVNVTDQDTNAQLQFPNRNIEAAFIVSVLEDIQTNILDIQVESLKIMLGAKEMKHLLVFFER